ncbi:CPBP family intramembrane glutamic endopeptidase [Streptococcus pneumoniae]|uniref:CPBP family intramembrane glutamic endopeptidase n=2 Tax=Streptococcus pneumoniae TaxID=1313 RepID=UPI00214DCFF9|nr:CPBP family intramembrane glutamic endopeptidase [Streptococcus pneumoniae]
MILSHRDPISLLYYSLIGFFFALVYRSTDNLRLTILCHSFFNFLNHAKPIWIFVYNYIYYPKSFIPLSTRCNLQNP